MESEKNVLVLSAVRTAIGKYGGGLAAVPPCDLAATVVREAVSRAGVAPADVGHAVFGHVWPTATRASSRVSWASDPYPRCTRSSSGRPQGR
jgi:acetyl-CoA acetyltransferase